MIWREADIDEDIAHRCRRNRWLIGEAALDCADGEPPADFVAGHDSFEFRFPFTQFVEQEHALVQSIDAALPRPRVLRDSSRSDLAKHVARCGILDAHPCRLTNDDDVGHQTVLNPVIGAAAAAAVAWALILRYRRLLDFA